ncbi:MAG: MmgE/PrpD family protein, partial [Nitrospinota bacterium]
MSTLSDRLAAFAAGMSWQEIPPEVRGKAKLHILDALGVGLAAAELDFARAVAGMVREWGGKEEATVLRHGDRLPAPHAALANGSFIHGLDFDDTHSASITHASACVVPAALAAAEAAGVAGAAGADGRSLLAAAVVGYEVTARIGGAAPGGFHARGFHPTPLCGAFGAAAAGGRLLGLAPRALADALGIVGSQAAGLQEFLDDGSSVKRLHPGWAAHSGLAAAELAGRGFSGARRVLEGRFGLYAAHVEGGRFSEKTLVGELGRRWETLSISFKPYPCCHFNHAAMDAARAIARERALEPHEVEGVELLVPELVAHIVCEPLSMKKAPPTTYAALFSLPYCVALALTKRRARLEDFSEEAIRDPELLSLAGRTSYTTYASPDFPRYFPGGVRVRLRGGETLERREPINRGHPENPMAAEEVAEKFRANASRALPPEQVEDVV